jgi:hypothetical protein
VPAALAVEPLWFSLGYIYRILIILKTNSPYFKYIFLYQLVHKEIMYYIQYIIYLCTSWYNIIYLIHTYTVWKATSPYFLCISVWVYKGEAVRLL